MKNTKVTPQTSIAKRSSGSGPAFTTAKHSPACANSSHDRGLAAEERCAQWLTQQGWLILERRLKTPFAEIDVLYTKSHREKSRAGIWHAVEVKTVTSDAFFLDRVGQRQRGRLLRAREYLQERHTRLVALDLMTVDESGVVTYFADFLS